MKLLKNKKTVNAIIYYLFIMLIIITIKPALFFNKNRLITNVGMDNGKTLLPFPMFISLLSITMYFLAHYLS